MPGRATRLEVDVSSERGPRRETDRDIKLEEIMHPAVTITPDASERETLKLLLENNVPGVPVVDEEGLLVGFVTDGHLLASALPAYLKVMADVSFVSEAGDRWVDYFAESAEKPVSEVMSTEVSQVELGTSEVVVAHKMVYDGVSSVVVTEGGKVVGVVYRLDLFAAVIGAKPD
ncbi:MAG: CBS domain-containing protein [Actinomycetota bacterium]|nr:CBS domain-containing protein [Actinomycetota bacterium]